MGMRYLPLFLDLHGCPVTLIGAGTVALRKARLLTAAGARLTVLAPAACTELAGWAEAGRLTWQAVPFSAEALLATGIGLFAAIPAVVFYNYFNTRIAGYGTRADGFAPELLNGISRQLDKGA